MKTYIYPDFPKSDELFVYFIDDDPNNWSDECRPAVQKEWLCRFTGGETFISSPALEIILDGYGSAGLGGNTIVVSEAQISTKKYGNMYFSIVTNKLYDSLEQAITAGYRSILRCQLKEAGVNGSWEWLFLPFLMEAWLASKKRILINLLKKIGVPLKDHGVRIIAHDSVGYYGPSQIAMIAEMIGLEDDHYFNADCLNRLGQNVFYIKPEGEIPQTHSRFYSENAELVLTRLVAEEKKFETNIPYDWQKIEEMKIFFSKASVSEAYNTTFGNTGEASLRLSHPDYCEGDFMGIAGEVSRTFLKKFCANYESSGTREYVNFSHHFGYKSLPDFRLWKK